MMDVDKVRDVPEDAELISNSQDIREYLRYVNGGGCIDEDWVGALFVDFGGGYGDIEAIWLCEDQFPANNDNVWMIYPENEYC